MPRTYISPADYERIRAVVRLTFSHGQTVAEAAARLGIAPEQCAALATGTIAQAVIRYVYEGVSSRCLCHERDAFALSRAGLRDVWIARLIDRSVADVERWTLPRNLHARIRRVDIPTVSRVVAQMRAVQLGSRGATTTTLEGHLARQYGIPWRIFARMVGHEHLNGTTKAEAIARQQAQGGIRAAMSMGGMGL